MERRLEKEELFKRLGTAIRLRRSSLGLSQDDLAERADMNRAHLGEVERGKRNPSFWAVYKLSIALELELEVLMREMVRLDNRFI